MAHAHAATLPLPLDAKRIVATAGVIALHVGVLMMLMMPARVTQVPAPDDTTPVPPDQRIVVPRIDPPPKPLPLPRPPHPLQPTQPTQVAIPEPVVDPVDQDASPVDVAMPDPNGISNTFEPGPVASSFVQLATRVAPPPVYPRRAIQLQLTGVVRLRIHVDASGKPLEVTVEQSSGHPLLDEAAVKVVQARWRFVPATRDGQPVEAWALVPIEFVLQ
jgi:protein TonB